MRGKAFALVLAALVTVMALPLAMPPAAHAAKPIIPLSLDVWSSKGGRGLFTPGGMFSVGDVPVIYFTVNRPCQTKLTLSGPGGTNAWTQSADYGFTYQRALGVVESSDAGTWQVVLDAVAGSEIARDLMSFTVVAGSPAPLPPPASQAPLPSTTSPPGQEQDATTQAPAPPAAVPPPGRKITEAAATEQHALLALRMADGLMAVNLNLDTNNDGKVTADDARTILKWSVTGYGGDVSLPQKQIIDAFGYPNQFSLSYGLDNAVDYNALVRTEVWFYPQHRKQVTFVGGEIYSADDLPDVAPAPSCSTLKPGDVDYFTTFDELKRRIGGSVEKMDLLPETFAENGVESYLGKNVTFMMSGGRLLYLRTFCTEPESAALDTGAIGQWLAALDPFRPVPVSAGGPWYCIKRGAQFIMRLPSKVAGAILPHELAPLGAAYLELQMGHLPVWRAASRVNDVATLQNNVNKARDLYRTEANRLNGQLNLIKQERDRLNAGPSALGITPREWMDRKKSLDQLIPGLERAHDGLDRAAGNLNVKDITRIAMQGIIKQTLGNIKNIVKYEIGEEVKNLTHGGVILDFLAGNGRDPGAIIDLILDGDISRAVGNTGNRQLIDRIKDDIKRQLAANAEYVRRNWQEVLNNTVAQVQAGGDKASSSVPQLPQAHVALSQIRNCRFDCKLHATWTTSMNQSDPYFGFHDWEYVTGAFKGRVFTGERAAMWGVQPARMKYVIEVDSDQIDRIETADYDILLEVDDPKAGLDTAYKISGTSAVRNRDKESGGGLYFELAGSDVGESLDRASVIRSQIYAGPRSNSTKTLSANSASYIRIDLSVSVPPARE